MTNSQIGILLYRVYYFIRYNLVKLAGNAPRNAAVGLVLPGAESTNLHLSFVYGQTCRIRVLVRYFDEAPKAFEILTIGQLNSA